MVTVNFINKLRGIGVDKTNNLVTPSRKNLNKIDKNYKLDDFGMPIIEDDNLSASNVNIDKILAQGKVDIFGAPIEEVDDVQDVAITAFQGTENQYELTTNKEQTSAGTISEVNIDMFGMPIE